MFFTRINHYQCPTKKSHAIVKSFEFPHQHNTTKKSMIDPRYASVAKYHITRARDPLMVIFAAVHYLHYTMSIRELFYVY